MQRYGGSILVGQRSGHMKLLSIEFDEEKESTEIVKQHQLFSKAPMKSLSKFRLHGEDNLKICCLGDDRPPVIYDVQQEEAFWQAKNAMCDDLQLKAPMKDLDCAFSDQGQGFLTSTAYGKVNWR
jgi:hypothetical protein